MSYYIVLSGTLGSGKSTCAKKLAKLLNGKRIDLDKILKDNKLDHLASDSGCDSAAIPAANFIKAWDIVVPLAKKLLEQNRIVIFDGCLFHREVLEYLIAKLQFPHHVFTLKASLDVCINRDKNRERTIGEGVAKEVYDLVLNNDFGILINTENKSVEETVAEIIQTISSSTS